MSSSQGGQTVPNPVSTRSQWVLRLLAILFGLGLVAFLEVGLRVAGYADTPVYVPPRLVSVVAKGRVAGEFEVNMTRHFSEEPLADGSPGIRTSTEYRLGVGTGWPLSGSMRDIHFKPEPDPGVERYFLLGGSASLGQNPVGPKIDVSHRKLETLGGGVGALAESQAISGYFRQQMTDRGHQVEVLNAGMIAQDSGGIRMIAHEVLAYKPTGLLIYMGNNEGIGLSYALKDEQLPSVQVLRGALRDLRLYRLLATTITRLRRPPADAGPHKGERREDKENRVLADVIRNQWSSHGSPLWVGDLPTDAVYTALQERYRQNLSAIVEEAKAHGTRVYVIPTAPHLLYPPFYPGHDPGITDRQVAQFREASRCADNAVKTGDFKVALACGQEEISIDPYHALGDWHVGWALGRQGQIEEGLQHLDRALLLDLSRKRTLPVYVEVARSVCEKLGCRSGDATSRLRELTLKEGFQVYDRLYGDHEHLEPAGNEWIATQFVELVTSAP